MAAPSIEPDQRNPADVAPTDSYRPADPVWIYRGGMWRSGIVESSSSRAATVTYRPNGARGTGVDTLTARYLLARVDADPTLDRAVDA
ncbi:MAG TPA: hypothetical protein VGJ07_19695 [Rugosimonospora sp.]|jgi:hypothetical protein